MRSVTFGIDSSGLRRSAFDNLSRRNTPGSDRPPRIFPQGPRESLSNTLLNPSWFPLPPCLRALVVLARGEADEAGAGADMIYYDHPGGGFVFSVGSITFGGSLVVDRTIQQLMRNVLTNARVS